MRILWHNVFAAAFALAALILLLKRPHEIGAFLGSMSQIGPGHTPEEQTIGLIAFGLIGVLIVAIARLLTNNRK